MSTARFFSMVAGLMFCIVIVGVVGVVRTPSVLSSVVQEAGEVVEETAADVVEVVTNPPRTLAPARSEEDEDEDDDDDSEGAPTVTQPVSSTPTAPTAAEKAFTLADVARHSVAADCYTVINGSVYDLTSFERSHPGGVANITALCGIDGTNAFSNQHGGERRPVNELSSLKIGILAK